MDIDTASKAMVKNTQVDLSEYDYLNAMIDAATSNDHQNDSQKQLDERLDGPLEQPTSIEHAKQVMGQVREYAVRLPKVLEHLED